MTSTQPTVESGTRTDAAADTDTDGECLLVELHEYDTTVYEGQETEVTVKLTNPTDEALTEDVVLRPVYGHPLLRGSFTIPANTVKAYTTGWHVRGGAAAGQNRLTVSAAGDSTTADVDIVTPASLDVLQVEPDIPSVGDTISLWIDLLNTDTVTDIDSTVTVIHERVPEPAPTSSNSRETRDSHPGDHASTQAQTPDQTVIHEETYRVPAGYGDDAGEVVSDTVRFTVMEPGTHVLRVANEGAEQSFSVTVADSPSQPDNEE